MVTDSPARKEENCCDGNSIITKTSFSCSDHQLSMNSYQLKLSPELHVLAAVLGYKAEFYQLKPMFIAAALQKKSKGDSIFTLHLG